MKKKIFLGIAALVIVVMAAYNVNLGLKTYGMSDISLTNVEALADYEGPEVVIECSQYGNLPINKCWEQECDRDLFTLWPLLKFTYCSQFTGYTWMVCYPDLPCW